MKAEKQLETIPMSPYTIPQTTSSSPSAGTMSPSSAFISAAKAAACPATRSTRPTSPSASDRDAYDRVFPVRSALKIEPQPGPKSPGRWSHQGSVPEIPITDGGSNYQDSAPGTTGNRSPSGEAFRTGIDGRKSTGPENSGFYTERHRHVVTEEGHMIVVGIEGTLQRCEDEPIHIPGAVQGFGCLVGLRILEEGAVLDIRVVSEVCDQK
jgi:hypothetical protein